MIYTNHVWRSRYARVGPFTVVLTYLTLYT